jgi:hypothetical protein
MGQVRDEHLRDQPSYFPAAWFGKLVPRQSVMIDRVLLSHVIGTDDTVMPMLAAAKTRQARMWAYQGDDDHPYNVFEFTFSRSLRDGLAGSRRVDLSGLFIRPLPERHVVLRVPGWPPRVGDPAAVGS